ncbi:putative fungal specific transcription factor domain containing protein [Erysiphe neolycopersici]|uniref:Putative fungal specific transcription factor domain containing protein n=1 Tax=Erysiphe neolycopersici TaxID=212602 RepID=A0A420I857_9PEZI|nr:putative fungal specific transcription factor domain containing protein [Erysiphe neolycopersici]
MTVVSTKILLAQSSFQQALQRRSQIQNAFSTEEIITDIHCILTNLSKTYKRYGSFVPGPMESRRRLGKRRMAYTFETIPSDKVEPWTWWRYLREHDFTDWTWEPPRSFSISQELKLDMAEFSPADWLLSIFNISKKKNSSKISKLEYSNNMPLYEEICNLRSTIDEGSKEIIFQACLKLNNVFNKCLRNGILSDKEIVKIIDEVSQLLRENMLEADVSNSLCYSFYQTTLDGLGVIHSRNRANSVFQPTIAILKWLSELPLNLKAQVLVASIIQNLPSHKLEEVPYEIIQKIFISWALSWHDDLDQVDPLDYLYRHSENTHEDYFSVAEEITARINLQLSIIDNLISQHKITYEISILLCQSRLKILTALKAIEYAENILMPKKLSSTNLANTLISLPSKLMMKLVADCSRNLSEIFQQNKNINSQNIKKYWLTAISQISILNDKEFLSLWKYLDIQCDSLSAFSYPELFINRWKNQCTPEEQAHIRNSIRITNIFPGEEFGPWVSLINVIYRFYPLESHFKNIGTLFGMLHEFGKVETLGNIILQMSKMSPRLSAEIIEFVLEKVIHYDSEMAWKIAMLSPIMKPGRKYRSERYPNGDHRTLRYSYCPNFVNWMIKDSKINPKFIWKLLRIPIHSEYSPRYRNQPSNKPLHTQTEDLLKRMAVAFAHAERLSPRVAFRNVMHCWHHLCHHKAPVDVIIVRALIHSGITRCIKNGMWVPETRKNWLFSLLEQVEDDDSVNQADQIVTAWNKTITSNKIWHQRESNVLCVGPID